METQISAYNPTLKQKIEDTFGISLLKLLQGAKASVPFIEQPAVGSVENEYQNSPQGKFAKTAVDTGSMAAGAGKNVLNSLRGIKGFEAAADLFRLNRALPKGVVVAQKTIDEAKHLRDLNSTMSSIKPVAYGLKEIPIGSSLANAGTKILNNAAVLPGVTAAPELMGKLTNEAGNAVGITRGDFNAQSPEQNSLELAGQTPPAQKTQTPATSIPVESYHKLQDMQMPSGNTTFADNLPAMPTAPTVQQEQDPLMTAIFNLLAQKPEQTAAVQSRDTAAVTDEFNRRNPKANPENKSGFDKALDFVGLGRGPAPLNPAELLKLQADLGISADAATGENALNRTQRQTEHAARVGGTINNRDILGVLAGKSNIRDQGQIQRELQSQATEGQSRLGKEQAGYRQQEIAQTAQAQTSPSAVRAAIAERNPEGLVRAAYEDSIGMKLSDAEWETIKNSNNKPSSAMEQLMVAILAQNFANRGTPRQGTGPVNTQALNK